MIDESHFKVTQTVRREDKGAHRECPYCGAFYDADLENALGVTTAFRSASARSLRFVICSQAHLVGPLTQDLHINMSVLSSYPPHTVRFLSVIES